MTLMDLRMPDISGIDAMIAIRSEFPDARVVMLTTFEGDVEIQRALAAGARGYLLKNMPPSELVDAVRQVHAGKKRIPHEVAAQLAEHFTDEPLTAREIGVLSTSPAATATATSPSTLPSRRKRSRCTSSTSWTSSARPIGRRPSRLRSAAASFSCSRPVAARLVIRAL